MRRKNERTTGGNILAALVATAITVLTSCTIGVDPATGHPVVGTDGKAVIQMGRAYRQYRLEELRRDQLDRRAKIVELDQEASK